MECPYCKKEMAEGYIYANQSAPVWAFGSAETLQMLGPEINLTEPGLFTNKRAPSWYCKDCKVLITPVHEYETQWDKMKDKWNSFTDKFNKQREEQAEERREKQAERAREKRRKKDPWEK